MNANTTENSENVNIKLKVEMSDVLNGEDIKKMLQEAGIKNYEDEVVSHLNDYINQYTVTVLNCATTFMKHAGRDNINVVDVNLAVDMIQAKNPSKRLSFKELIKLAQEQNKDPLPQCNGLGIPLPRNEHTLSQCNYKLKSSNAQKIWFNPSPLIDVTNGNNSILMNPMKNHAASIPTMIRTSAGTVSVNVPMNLVPHRIILKQSPFNTFEKVEDNTHKRLKAEDIKKHSF